MTRAKGAGPSQKPGTKRIVGGAIGGKKIPLLFRWLVIEVECVSGCNVHLGRMILPGNGANINDYFNG